MELKQHPLSAAFPAMSAEDFAALVDDVRANGQRDPIMLHEGMVLDGWHRYQACLQIGAKPQKFDFAAGKDPVAFVLSQNLHRRHLTPSQRAAAIVACSDYGQHGGARSRGKVASCPQVDAKPPKVDDLAKAAQVAPRLIKDAAVAKRAGLLDEVKDGTISATKAAEIARGKTPGQESAKEPKRQLISVEPVLTASDAEAELRDTVRELAEENDQLRDRLAVEAMDASEEEKTVAAETIRELRAQVQTLEAELRAVKASRDGLMRTDAEQKKQIAYWRKQAEKAQQVSA